MAASSGDIVPQDTEQGPEPEPAAAEPSDEVTENAKEDTEQGPEPESAAAEPSDEMKENAKEACPEEPRENAELAEPSGEPQIKKPIQFPQPNSDMLAEVLAQYPDTPVGRWCATRPQVGIIGEDGSVQSAGTLDDVVAAQGPDYPVLRQGGENPVFSTAGYEAMIADIAEDKGNHKSGMTPMEEKVFREYPEAYHEIQRMAADQGVLSPKQEMEQVEQMKLIVEKWKQIYKERATTREETLKKALGDKGFKNRKTTARRMGMSAKAYEDKVLAKIYAAETEALSQASASPHGAKPPRASGTATR